MGYTEFGGPDVWRVLELPEPRAGPRQVRVRVQAAAVNPADTAARSGWMKQNYAPHTLPGGSYPEPPYRTGWDFCGVLDEAPDGGSIGVGEQVIELTLSPMGKVGAHAEYVVTDSRAGIHRGQRQRGLRCNVANGHLGVAALEEQAHRRVENVGPRVHRTTGSHGRLIRARRPFACGLRLRRHKSSSIGQVYRMYDLSEQVIRHATRPATCFGPIENATAAHRPALPTGVA